MKNFNKVIFLGLFLCALKMEALKTSEPSKIMSIQLKEDQSNESNSPKTPNFAPSSIILTNVLITTPDSSVPNNVANNENIWQRIDDMDDRIAEPTTDDNDTDNELAYKTLFPDEN